jgi:hypothetical protein
MKTERRNTFETNSSSTHSMIILTEEENEKISSGGLFLKNKYNDDIITKEEADKILMEAIVEYNLQYPEGKIETIEEFKETDWYLDNRAEYPCDIEEWSNYDYLEYDYSTYTSPSGDNLVIHCVYGRD